MIPKLDQPEDRQRLEWMEKYVIAIDYVIKGDGDPMFRILYTSNDERHLMITDGSSLCSAIDRAILSTDAKQP